MNPDHDFDLDSAVLVRSFIPLISNRRVHPDANSEDFNLGSIYHGRWIRDHGGLAARVHRCRGFEPSIGLANRLRTQFVTSI